MADMKEIVKLAIDAYKGSVEKYSVGQSQEALRQALVEANGGSTKLDYKAIRDGKCNGLFALIEEILSRTVVEGLTGDEFFNALVDFRNVAEGDQNIFIVEDSNLFVIDDVANGTQGIRRQRLGGSNEVSIPTTMKMVRIYEELNRVLAGRVDFNHFINVVAESFRQKMLNDIYTLWSGATADDLGGVAYFPAAGSYNEDELLELISHVEAAAGGKTATIVGTKKALRALKDAIDGDVVKNDLYNLGYVGKFYGTPVVATPNRHKVGTTDFVFADDVLTIIAGDDKPIKFVYEGDPIVLMGDPMQNADFTQEYLYGEKYGLGIVLAGGNAGIGRYQTA
ncbi:MAG: hypothetical protein IJ298_00910 [Ruminococcus sp.]|nr:hypothetical protein [Ruminococcus sp.]